MGKTRGFFVVGIVVVVIGATVVEAVVVGNATEGDAGTFSVTETDGDS